MWFECVPNISEGRNPEVVASCVEAVTAHGGRVLDVERDPDHNRAVLTLALDEDLAVETIFALVQRAIGLIDLREHRGVHPRLGAVDVVPIVPMCGATMTRAVELAREAGALVADRLRIPVFLYEAAAERPERRRLEHIRAGGFEQLQERLRQPEWTPDYGPLEPHPSAGAAVFGARAFLVAFNVNLASDDLDLARAIAAAVRERSGGLPGVKAMGVRLASRHMVQVSMNLTDLHKTTIVDAFRAVEIEAEGHGIAVVESELVGLAPNAVLSADIASEIRLRDFGTEMILENRLRAAGVDCET
jgi:glutamate formiminotransferase